MTEQEAIAKIHSVYPTGKKNGLENMRALMEKLGGVQDGLRMVHVAGTNGKGSCCAMIERVLREAGYHTGLYSSPYIETYNERIRIDGRPVSGGMLAELVEAVWPAMEACEAEGVHITEFELGTALAFLAFAREKTDVAIIEVGLGGRLDPTNIIIPAVCAITGVGMDHMAFLGDTIEAIAGEKAGIIKPGVPLSLAPQTEAARRVILAQAAACGAPVLEAAADHVCESADGVAFDARLGGEKIEGLRVSLCGRHQADNACAALGVIAALRRQGMAIPEDAVRAGFGGVHWPGRLERFGNVLLDGAHNDPGVRALCAYCDKWLDPGTTVLLTGMMADKETQKMTALLAPRVKAVVAAQPKLPRAMAAEALAAAFAENGAQAVAVPDAAQALSAAREMAGPQGTVLAAGSLYLIGEVRALLRKEKEFADVI